MSGGNEKEVQSFLFVKDANLMTLDICDGMFLIQRETVVFYNWDANTQSFATQNRFLSVQFHVSLVITVFIRGDGMSTSVHFLDFVMQLVLILGLERNWRLRLQGVCKCSLPSQKFSLAGHYKRYEPQSKSDHAQCYNGGETEREKNSFPRR